jgi:hypothetical protein
MPEDNPARKSFEASARTTREAVDRGTAAAEQAPHKTSPIFLPPGTPQLFRLVGLVARLLKAKSAWAVDEFALIPQLPQLNYVLDSLQNDLDVKRALAGLDAARLGTMRKTAMGRAFLLEVKRLIGRVSVVYLIPVRGAVSWSSIAQSPNARDEPPSDPRGVIRIARKLYLKNSILRDSAIEQKRQAKHHNQRGGKPRS